MSAIQEGKSIQCSDAELTVAYEYSAGDSTDRYKWLLENAPAIEYSPDPQHLEAVPLHVTPFLNKDIPVRFHTRYFEYEMGSADRQSARIGLDRHMKTIDAIRGLGEPFITVHIGLNRTSQLSSRFARDNLCRLVEYASGRGIRVSLENMRDGPASNPDFILALSQASGSLITLDIGHAVSSEVVKQGIITPAEIAVMFNRKLGEVHIYAKEENDRHHPITDITPLKSVLGKLLESPCRWWTVELKDTQEAVDTRGLLLDYLRHKE
ncbi:MAG: TIM barrel protein [Dehalococcoidaceae bacterium]|nr:TIM barrel protein [Dehalococcoidaceae bacterium]